MKTTDLSNRLILILVFILLFLLPLLSLEAQVINDGRSDLNKPETELPAEIYWHVKAFHPDAQLLDVKALDAQGNIYAIKAIQDFDDTSILNVKALVNDLRLPVKLIVRENEPYFPVKAIMSDGTLLDVKALTPEGDILDVKGISRSGNTVTLKALAKDGTFYSIIAVAPDGSVNTVKGVKMMDNIVEGVVNGVSIYAHIKALHQN